MTSSTRNIVYSVALILVFGGGVMVGTYASSERSVQSTTRLSATTLMVDYGNGRIDTYATTTPLQGVSLFHFLQIAMKEKQVLLQYKDYGGDMGVFIESINGIGKDSSGKKYWQYWVNNGYGQIGVSNYLLRQGDSVEFKFIQGQV